MADSSGITDSTIDSYLIEDEKVEEKEEFGKILAIVTQIRVLLKGRTLFSELDLSFPRDNFEIKVKTFDQISIGIIAGVIITTALSFLGVLSAITDPLVFFGIIALFPAVFLYFIDEIKISSDDVSYSFIERKSVINQLESFVNKQVMKLDDKLN